MIGKWTRDEMEKVAKLVPGEKKEPPGPYSIGFENIYSTVGKIG